MDKFVIKQSMNLNGDIEISGSKNAALPLLCASLLTSDKLILKNVPNIKDVRHLMQLLRDTGVKIVYANGNAICDASVVQRAEKQPNHLAKDIRASVLLLGPLLTRVGYVEIPLPGGCAIGARPIDEHIQGLALLGARIVVEKGYIKASAASLIGAHIIMDVATVTGTENLLMAAVLAQGTSILENAAREPEVDNLCDCLIKMGANISGIGTSVLTVRGVDCLHGAMHDIMPDRIEAGTYAMAAVITQGDLTLTNVQPDCMEKVIKKLRIAGACVFEGQNMLRVVMERRPNPVDIITLPYPGFPTDLQAPMMVLNCVANGSAYITETVYENRFQHVAELQRMNAKIQLFGQSAKIIGCQQLRGAKVVASDLRACAALVLAGLRAEGETVIDKVDYLDRGYECMQEKLTVVGANISRV